MEMISSYFERPAFRDREDAGRSLGAALKRLGGMVNPIVLGLPRGGLPVAFEVARAVHAPLDVWVVRKLGHPLQTELAIGAIASGGVRVLNEALIARTGLPAALVEQISAREHEELKRREKAYRGDAPPQELRGRSVILVDDGLATGATMSAAVAAVRQLGPHEVIVAVPVAPADTVQQLLGEADRVVCLEVPEPFLSIGSWYGSFPQLEDGEVLEIMRRSRADLRPAAPGTEGP